MATGVIYLVYNAINKIRATSIERYRNAGSIKYWRGNPITMT